MGEKEGSSETLQAVGVLSGITAFCVIFFNALTSAGVDDIIAGNLLLVALAGAGAALFFFDGGATQKALEAGAVQQVANEEGALMEEAPLLPDASVGASFLASDPSTAAAALAEEGVVFIDGLLDEVAAAEVRRYVEAWLVQAKQDAAEDTAPEQRFGGVLSRTNRYDLYLPLEGPVESALKTCASKLRTVLEGVLGDNPELYELSALVSDKGAPRQPVHPDTGYSNSTAIVTAFVALQDVTGEMGPTFFLAGTQSQAAHLAFNGEPAAKAELLRTSPRRLGTVRAGDATVFDSRLLHGGGANDQGRRILFYFSFKARESPRLPKGSLLTSLRYRHSLDSLLAPEVAAK